MRKFTLSILASLLFSGIFFGQQQNCFRVGMHSDNNMFLNLFKLVYSSSFSSVPCDTNGYPVAIPYGATTQVTAIVSAGEGVIKNDSIYVCRWDGEGKLDVWTWFSSPTNQITIYSNDSANRRMEFSVHYSNLSNDDKQVHIQIKKSRSTNHVRNIRVYLKRFENLYENQGEVFNPDYLRTIQPFWMLRFMGSFNTNNSPFRTWADRTTPGWYTQSSGNHGCGLAYEWACDLCNKTKKNMWFNVPHAADDDAVRKMAQLVYSRLSSDLDVYLEYSNETWNWAGPFFQQFNYTQNYPGGHSALSKNIFRIWRQVFGKDSLRVKRVLASIGVSDVNHISFGRIQATGVDNFDVWSVTYYWGDVNTSWCNADQAINELRTSVRDLNGEWHKRMKNHSDMAKQLGKEMYCYEGGWGSDPVDYHNYSCLSVVQGLQKDSRIEALTMEVMDTLKAMGIYGGNELSLLGGWKPNAVNNLVSFWGLYDNITADPMTYPKYSGLAKSIQDCDHLMKNTDTIGAGNAIRLDGGNDYVDASLAYKPNDVTDNYTLEAWVKPEYLGTDQYIWSLAKDLSPAGNNLYISSGNRFMWVVKNNAGTQIVSLQGPLVETNKWYHVLAVKNGSIYKLYINGAEKASAAGSISGACDRSRFILGAYLNNGAGSKFFRGRLDEVRIWNNAFSNLTNMRDWMCRKVTSAHPNYANLRAYYRFDIVNISGSVKDQFGAFNAQLMNVGFSKYSNYELSGAPIGDNSVQLYPPNWTNVSLTYYHTNGDRMTVSNLGYGVPEGVQIYMVKQKPTDSNLPSSEYTKMGSYYYGIFTCNGTPGLNPTYNVIYTYSGNPDASGTDAYNRLLKRDGNDDLDGWQNTGAFLNAYAKTLMTRSNKEKYKGEYIIGVRPSVAKTMPGPGYSLKFNGSTKAELYFDRPDSAYTINFWFKNTSGDWSDIVNFYGPGYQNFTKIRIGGSNQFGFTTDKYWDQITVGYGYSVIESSGGWNYASVVKKNDIVTVYVNGRQIGTGPCGYTKGGNKRDIDFHRLTIGEGFDGWIDELQVWDMAIDSSTIRKWMCRKITKKNPYEAQHLMLYYNFDEGSGTSLENTRGPGDLMLYSGCTFNASSAPVGDTSVYVYYSSPSGHTGSSLSIKHPNGDYFRSQVGAGTLNGMHLYRVDGNPQFSTYPPEVQSMDTTRYWGAFIVPDYSWGSMNTYTIACTYNYAGNKNVVEEANIRLLDRNSNADAAWHYNATPTPDVVTDIFSPALSYTTPKTSPYWPNFTKVDKEFMLGGTTPTAIKVDTAKPAQPAAITGPTSVCSGSFALVYSIPKITNADFYVWTLPVGLAGYSDSNKIYVNVDPTANGALGNISVYGVNRNGNGPSRSLAITAQLVPSLSVEINGPVEACSGQTSTYSIPSVPGTISYNWFVTDDGTIVTNAGTSISVRFGILSGNISVLGTFGCGTSVINNKAVTVYTTPKADLEIIGGRACKGIETSGYITIKSSQLGVQYQAYRSGGTAPVGPPVVGTGLDLRIDLPLSDLLSGDNVITVKGKIGSCTEVTMAQTPTFSVDISPDPNMLLAYSTNVCVGDTAKINFPDALPGMIVNAKIISHWRVDDPSPKFMAPGVTLDNTKTLNIAPSVFNGQLSSGSTGAGINKGLNEISFTITNGSCPVVSLNKKAFVTVPNSPHTIDFHNSGLMWWINTGSPWDPYPNIADSIRVSTNRPNSPICETDSMIYTVYNAQAGVKYYCRIYYNTNGSKGYPGATVSNEVTPSADHSTVILKVPSYSMPLTPGTNSNDFDEIEVMAEGSGCKPVLASWRYQVVPGPDTTKLVVGSTVCQGDNGTITIRNSQNGLTYRAYFHNPVTPIATAAGNGGDALLTIPKDSIPALGSYTFVIAAGNSNCQYIAFSYRPKITVITTLTVTNAVKLAYDADTTCKGLSDSIWVMNSAAGVSYRAYVNGTAVGVPTIGTGRNMSITLPYSDLATYEGTTVTVSVKATAGSCAVDVPLVNTKQLYINGTVDLTHEVVSINKGADWRNGGTFMICPPITYPVQFPVRLNTDSMGTSTIYYPTYYRAAYTTSDLLNDTLVNVTTSQTTVNTWSNLNFNNAVLPQRSLHYLEILVKENGCPLHSVRMTRHTNQYINTNSRLINVYPDFDPNQLVLNDTVCIGNVGKIRVKTQEGRMSDWGGDYRMVDTATNVTVADASNRWGDRAPNTDDNGYLLLPLKAPSYLHAGANTFRIDMSFGGCPSWYTLNTWPVMYANQMPDKTLTAEAFNNCDAAQPAKAIIRNAQNLVTYQPVMGTSAVAQPKTGNGTDLTFDIDKKYIGPGSNQVSFTATIKGCATVSLDTVVPIQDVTLAPGQPPIPVGQNSVCPYDSNIIYSVPLDSSVEYYTWVLPSGTTTTSKTNVALVNFGTTIGGPANISVVAVNSCGPSIPSDPLSISFNPPAQSGTISGSTIACEGDAVDINLKNHVGNVAKWQFMDSTGIWTDILISDSILNTGILSDTISYRAQIKSGNCDSAFTSVFTINVPKGSADTSKMPPIKGDTAISCLEKDITYTLDAIDKTFVWSVSKDGYISSAANTSFITVNWHTSGIDTVTVIAENTKTGCRRMAVLPVIIAESLPVINNCNKEVNLDRGAPYKVSGSELDPLVDGSSCNFDYLINSINQGNTLSGTELKNTDTVITWTAFNKSKKDTTCKIVIHFAEIPAIDIPDAFTPDGNGYNDKWMIKNVQPGDLVQVFDRWGNKVFESKDYTGNEWNGKNMNGRDLPVDSYHYLIFKNGSKKAQRGIVTIIRRE